ncbi:PDR/VanB family oxidoreductase [Hydrogenophaga flava]|uniref:PDR/VanB family oxidoreductase n=1 Tax=Hydrogenophaga flava TaxID=65657 RepID=UPI000ABEC171|nr:PDR/VanB family oxidoreductase [Hydrogenophaga flava]
MTMTTLSVRVACKRQEALGIASFMLTALDGAHPLPAFDAGAHIDVHVAPGVVRQYSLCNDPQDRGHYRIAVLREPQSRGGSAGMHEQVIEGKVLTISTPRNHFPLAPAGPARLMAGGIGITPLLSMAMVLHAQGRFFQLHYACRSEDRVAFRDQLSVAPFADRVHLHLDDGAASQRLAADTLLANPLQDEHLYVCGPKGFIDHVLAAARTNHWREEQLHREYFGAVTSSAPDGAAFEVELARTGRRLQVPGDRSVLEVLLSHGLDLPYSCESGVCGTCLTPVLGGQPDHRDSFFTDEERAAGTQFLPCCSRSKTPVLVLDL